MKRFCEGRAKYASRKGALISLREFWVNSIGRDPATLEVAKCHKCGTWHVQVHRITEKPDNKIWVDASGDANLLEDFNDGHPNNGPAVLRDDLR